MFSECASASLCTALSGELGVRRSQVLQVSLCTTPQPLYNTVLGVQANICVTCSYPNHVILRVKCIDYIGKGVLNGDLESNSDQCCIQNCVITNRVIKRLGCTFKLKGKSGKENAIVIILKLDSIVILIFKSTASKRCRQNGK